MPYLSVTETAYPTTVVEATTYASITDGEITLTVQIPGTESVSVTTATAAGVNDHGGLTGLGDDDHTIYSLVDGTRAFTAVVTGVAPSSDLHLSTKKYVDDKTWTESDITDLDHTVDVVSNVAQDRLLGRTAAGSGNSEELTQAASLTFLGVESGATADQTGAQIKTAYEGEADTNAYNDAAVTKLAGIEAAADVTDATNVNAAGAAMNTDWDAQTILLAVSDDTPVATTIGASTFVGRKAAGNAGTMSVAEALTLLGVEAGATADQTAGDIRTLGFFDTSNDGTGSGLDADLLDGNEATAFAAVAGDTITGSFVFTPSAAGTVPIDVTGHATQSGDLANILTTGDANGLIIDSDGVLMFGDGQSVDGSGSPAQLSGDHTFDTLSTFGLLAGVGVRAIVNSSSTATIPVVRGMDLFVEVNGAANVTAGAVSGLRTRVSVDADADNISQATGSDTQAQQNDTVNTAPLLRGLWATVSTAASATTTKAVAAYLSPSSTGTTTTLYGLEIADVTTGGTNYAIYTGAGTVSLGDNVDLRDGYLQMTEESGAPAAPAANGCRIYCVDNGGKTELLAIFASGAAQQIAIEP